MAVMASFTPVDVVHLAPLFYIGSITTAKKLSINDYLSQEVRYERRRHL
jgi:hypothetical protein